MGKGYNNYMCKKPFHPGSKANIKRAWMAEQKTENEKRKQDELKTQYEKEQDLYNNRAMISSESKEKLELNFMYEAPPGAKRERLKEDDEPEYKFEWQRKYNAPREDYARGNEDIKDQPFGIPVRNVRCIKCHKWGHINTDRECPLFMQASASSMPTTSMDPMELMRQMREDGLGLKENVLGHHMNPKAANQQFIQSEESDPEAEFLKSLSTADKKKLLRKLKKLSKKQEKKKKSKKSKKSKLKDSSDSDSEENFKRKKKKSKKKSCSSSSESSSDESDDEREAKSIKKRHESSSRTEKKKYGRKDKIKSRISSIERRQSNHQDNQELKHKKSNDSEKKLSKQNRKETKVKKEEDSISERQTTKASSHTYNRDIESKKKIKSEEASSSDIKSSSNEDSKTSNQSSITSTWKSSYSPSSSDSNETPKKESKNIKSEESGTSLKSLKKQNDLKPEHPDGFCHSFPQVKVAYGYLVPEENYKGKMHDEFRHHFRDIRSPSVKQKYYS